jgi:hypothetical protein
MVEKKFVVDGIKLTYNGPFDIVDFYKSIDDWIEKKGKEREIKKKVEHVEKEGKKIEWFIEIWEDVAEYARITIRLRALFNNVTEVSIKKGKKKKTLNKGNALMVLDGIFETDLVGKWQNKPMPYFFRALANKFVWRFKMNKFEDKLAKDTYELKSAINDFFKSYKI